MTYDPERHHRRSIRIKNYDYQTAGAYFITICAQDRACFFGEIIDSKMNLNDAGRMVQATWDELPVFYPGVETDYFVVMPNHIHGIIVLVGAGPRACPGSGDDGVRVSADSLPEHRGAETGQPRGVAPTGEREGESTLSLSDVVHRFKTLTTKRYTDGVKQAGWAPYRGRFWQRNYYEHVVRDEAGLDRFRRYIEGNPARWADDDENPNKIQQPRPSR
jgi:REP element-mobilizing transposase RayT